MVLDPITIIEEILSGDVFGGIILIYTGIFGDLFWGLIFFVLSIGLYVRTKSIGMMLAFGTPIIIHMGVI